MEFEQSTISAMVSFFMKVTAAVSVICVSKLYKIVSCIEDDAHRKYYLTYYKISELENYIEALQNDVSHMKEMCVQFEDKLAMQKVLLQHAYHALPQEDIVIENEIINNDINDNDINDNDINDNNNEETMVDPVPLINKSKEENESTDGQEKEKEQDYEHVNKADPGDPEPKYRLWKGVY
jgi:hypothetical protein